MCPSCLPASILLQVAGPHVSCLPASILLQVAGTDFEFVTSSSLPAFRKVDSYTYLFATKDYLTHYYVTLPKSERPYLRPGPSSF